MGTKDLSRVWTNFRALWETSNAEVSEAFVAFEPYAGQVIAIRTITCITRVTDMLVTDATSTPLFYTGGRGFAMC